MGVLCINDWTDPDAVCESNEPCIRLMLRSVGPFAAAIADNNGNAAFPRIILDTVIIIIIIIIIFFTLGRYVPEGV